MSVQFGIWNFEGQQPALDYIEKVSTTLAPYGPDSIESYSMGGMRILYHAFHTTKESRREKQPCIAPSGAVITWDGRLDNRAELIGKLHDSVTRDSTDVEIVAAAFERWGDKCLGKLIGDWTLSIWNPDERSLLLAKDPIGTRHLYYSFDDKQLTWSTILDPLILFAGRTFEICEEYIAGGFAIPVFPAAHLTPYVGIHSVPPSSSVLLRPGKHSVSKYWDFDPGRRIRYRTDAEYEEHFRSALAIAVQRRLRSDRPVLAELSGGMDSSSIVCMADTVIARGAAETPRLDTISWYDDTYDHIEPDMNELPYFTKVEEKRGRTGCHINLRSLGDDGSEQSFASDFERDPFAATPTHSVRRSELFKQYAACMRSQGHRVVLSGLGGDEATGSGVPTPRQELQNLLARAQFVLLAHQLNAWAVKMRKSRLSLLSEAIRGFFPLALAIVPKDLRPDPWFHPDFVRRNRDALCGYRFRVKLIGPLPSFQDNLDKLEAERRLQAYFCQRSDLLRDLRYPYLDRGFLEFMYAIPREQIVRVGQRRSLMKRALVGIVPAALLERKRKTVLRRAPVQSISTEWPSWVQLGQPMISSSIGIIDPNRFWEVIRKAQRNEETPLERLKRTLFLELWLRHLTIHGVLANAVAKERQDNRLPPKPMKAPRASSAKEFS